VNNKLPRVQVVPGYICICGAGSMTNSVDWSSCSACEARFHAACCPLKVRRTCENPDVGVPHIRMMQDALYAARVSSSTSVQIALTSPLPRRLGWRLAVHPSAGLAHRQLHGTLLATTLPRSLGVRILT